MKTGTKNWGEGGGSVMIGLEAGVKMVTNPISVPKTLMKSEEMFWRTGKLSDENAKMMRKQVGKPTRACFIFDRNCEEVAYANMYLNVWPGLHRFQQHLRTTKPRSSRPTPWHIAGASIKRHRLRIGKAEAIHLILSYSRSMLWYSVMWCFDSLVDFLLFERPAAARQRSHGNHINFACLEGYFDAAAPLVSIQTLDWSKHPLYIATRPWLRSCYWMLHWYFECWAAHTRRNAILCPPTDQLQYYTQDK